MSLSLAGGSLTAKPIERGVRQWFRRKRLTKSQGRLAEKTSAQVQWDQDVEVDLSHLPPLEEIPLEEPSLSQNEEAIVTEAVENLVKELGHLQSALKNIETRLSPVDLSDFKKEKGRFIRELSQLGEVTQRTVKQLESQQEALKNTTFESVHLQIGWGQILLGAIIGGLVAGLLNVALFPLVMKFFAG